MYVKVWFQLCIFGSFSFKDYVNGGELFTHLYNREHFTEDHAKFYTAEVGVALDFLHKVYFLFL